MCNGLLSVFILVCQPICAKLLFVVCTCQTLAFGSFRNYHKFFSRILSKLFWGWGSSLITKSDCPSIYYFRFLFGLKKLYHCTSATTLVGHRQYKPVSPSVRTLVLLSFVADKVTLVFFSTCLKIINSFGYLLLASSSLGISSSRLSLRVSLKVSLSRASSEASSFRLNYVPKSLRSWSNYTTAGLWWRTSRTRPRGPEPEWGATWSILTHTRL